MGGRSGLRYAAWALPLLLIAALIAYFARPHGGERPGDAADSGELASIEDGPESGEPGENARAGREDERKRERRDGEKPVLADVTVEVVDPSGAPVSNATVEVRAIQAEYDGAAKRTRASSDDWAGDDDGDDDADGEAREHGNRDPEWSDGKDDWGDGDADDGEEGDDGEEEEDTEQRRTVIATAITDGKGLARFQVWPEVDLHFRARDANGRQGVSRQIEVADPRAKDKYAGWKDVLPAGEILRIRIDALARITGRVFDERGRPVPGVDLYVTALSGVELDDGSDTESTSAVTKADGTYRFDLPDSGAFDIETSAEGFQEAYLPAVQALAGREVVRDITLKAAEEIAGVVLDSRSKPLPDVAVVVAPVGTQTDFWSAFNETNMYGEYTDSKGRFRFRTLPPGVYNLSVDPEDEGRPVELFDVRTGTKDVVMRVSPGGRIEARVHVRNPETLGMRKGDGERTDHRDGSYEDDWGPAGDDDDDEDWNDDDDGEARPRPARAPLTRWMADVLLTPLEKVTAATGVPAGRELESMAGVMRRGRSQALRLDESGHGTLLLEGLPSGEFDLLVRSATQAIGRRRVRVTENATTQISLGLPDATVEPAPTPKEPLVDRAAQRAPIAARTPSRSRAFPEGSHRPDVRLRMIDHDRPELGLVVSSAGPGSPPLQGGDRLLAIDGESVEGQRLWEIDSQLIGEEGSQCRILVERPATGERIETSMPRVIDHKDDDDGW